MLLHQYRNSSAANIAGYNHCSRVSIHGRLGKNHDVQCDTVGVLYLDDGFLF